MKVRTLVSYTFGKPGQEKTLDPGVHNIDDADAKAMIARGQAEALAEEAEEADTSKDAGKKGK